MYSSLPLPYLVSDMWVNTLLLFLVGFAWLFSTPLSKKAMDKNLIFCGLILKFLNEELIC
jgi:hypothetical protein